MMPWGQLGLVIVATLVFATATVWAVWAASRIPTKEEPNAGCQTKHNRIGAGYADRSVSVTEILSRLQPEYDDNDG